jgi:hypothetical protein
LLTRLAESCKAKAYNELKQLELWEVATVTGRSASYTMVGVLDTACMLPQQHDVREARLPCIDRGIPLVSIPGLQQQALPAFPPGILAVATLQCCIRFFNSASSLAFDLRCLLVRMCAHRRWMMHLS